MLLKFLKDMMNNKQSLYSVQIVMSSTMIET